MAYDPLFDGEFFQIAYVVEDLDAAMHHWIETMGVGPFFTFPMPLTFDWLKVNEQLTEKTDVLSGVALAQHGALQIELLSPGPDPSPYRDFLDAGREGMHHVGIYAKDYDAEMAKVRERGVEVAIEGELPLSRFSYVRTDEVFAGTMVELIDAKQEMRDLYQMITDASIGWDGSDPIRKLGG